MNLETKGQVVIVSPDGKIKKIESKLGEETEKLLKKSITKILSSNVSFSVEKQFSELEPISRMENYAMLLAYHQNIIFYANRDQTDGTLCVPEELSDDQKGFLKNNKRWYETLNMKVLYDVSSKGYSEAHGLHEFYDLIVGSSF